MTACLKKLQTSNSKLQRNAKLQKVVRCRLKAAFRLARERRIQAAAKNPCARASGCLLSCGAWSLKFELWAFSGCWRLEFGASRSFLLLHAMPINGVEFVFERGLEK